MTTSGKGCWGEASGVLLRSIEQLNSQELRTSTADLEANRALISQDPSCFLSRCSPAGTSNGLGIEAIEYIDEASVGIEEFSSRFTAPGRPCMIRGCADGWPARERWASAEALVRSRGHVEVRVTELFSLPRSYFPSAKANPLRIPLKNYCAYAESNLADFPWYGFDDDFTRCEEQGGGGRGLLLDDFTVPPYFADDCYSVSDEARQLFPKSQFFIVGGARTGTGLHVDPSCTSAWNTLLSGRKRWVLFPPGTEGAYKELLGVQEEYSRKLSPPCKWWREDYERIVKEASDGSGSSSFRGMIECIQEAGETIFVPAGWWHAVLNLDFTVAITANPLPPASLHQAWTSFSAACPSKSLLRRVAHQCAARWPDKILPESQEALGAPISQQLVALARGDAGEEEEEEEEEEVAAEYAELRCLGESADKHARGGVLFLDMDGAFKSEGGGDLRQESLEALVELVSATRCEIVLTSSSRVAEVTRVAIKERLNSCGLDFTRWVTAAAMAGGRSAQILEFVTKHVAEQSWAVVDSVGVGSTETGLMLHVLLASRCVISPQFGPGGALEAAKILLDADDDEGWRREEEEYNN